MKSLIKDVLSSTFSDIHKNTLGNAIFFPSLCIYLFPLGYKQGFMPLNIKTYNMTGKTKNFGLERDYIFHLVTNLTKVLPWALKGGCV